MKTVSLRAFRDSLGKVDLETEPVDVVVRRDGYLITLGRWTPTGYLEPVRPFDQTNHSSVGLKPDPARPEHDRPRVILNDIMAGRPFTPVPKPGRK